MIATLALATALAQQPAAQSTNFAPRFAKGETTSYVAKVTGSDGGNEVMFHVEFDLTVTDDAKEGKTPCRVKYTKVVANFGGNEDDQTIDDAEVTLNKFGVPTSMEMEGPSSIGLVSLVMQYLPSKEMKVGDTYFGDLDLGGAKVTLSGSYAGEETLEGTKYAVLKSKSTLTPTGEEAATLDTKSYFDAATGKVVRTESTIMTPDGEFKLTVTAKPKKA